MKLRVTIAQESRNVIQSETFLRAHAERLPADVTVVHRIAGTPAIDGTPVFSRSLPARALRKARDLVLGRGRNWAMTAGYLEAFRVSRPDVVLAEYGPMGVDTFDACQIAGIPLVVHFHGYDASKRSVLERLGEAYRRMFRGAAAVVAVSRMMRARLIDLGADPNETHVNPCGIDCEQFQGGRPHDSDPVFLAVGRFVDKKAPQLTIRAFEKSLREVPEARLKMIGDGPLLPACMELAHELRIEQAVEFLGSQSHDVVASEMKAARALVQHSVEAPNGDCEGTPVAVMEAGGCGLPVIATRHAGIPDVVLEGETGLLVDEHDVDGMAQHIIQLALDAQLAGRLGSAARARVTQEFSMGKSIARLFEVLEQAARATTNSAAPTNSAAQVDPTVRP